MFIAGNPKLTILNGAGPMRRIQRVKAGPYVIPAGARGYKRTEITGKILSENP